jgi:hypothetical protein
VGGLLGKASKGVRIGPRLAARHDPDLFKTAAHHAVIGTVTSLPGDSVRLVRDDATRVPNTTSRRAPFARLPYRGTWPLRGAKPPLERRNGMVFVFLSSLVTQTDISMTSEQRTEHAAIAKKTDAELEAIVDLVSKGAIR